MISMASLQPTLPVKCRLIFFFDLFHQSGAGSLLELENPPLPSLSPWNRRYLKWSRFFFYLSLFVWNLFNEIESALASIPWMNERTNEWMNGHVDRWTGRWRWRRRASRRGSASPRTTAPDLKSPPIGVINTVFSLLQFIFSYLLSIVQKMSNFYTKKTNWAVFFFNGNTWGSSMERWVVTPTRVVLTRTANVTEISEIYYCSIFKQPCLIGFIWEGGAGVMRRGSRPQYEGAVVNARFCCCSRVEELVVGVGRRPNGRLVVVVAPLRRDRPRNGRLQRHVRPQWVRRPPFCGVRDVSTLFVCCCCFYFLWDFGLTISSFIISRRYLFLL